MQFFLVLVLGVCTTETCLGLTWRLSENMLLDVDQGLIQKRIFALWQAMLVWQAIVVHVDSESASSAAQENLSCGYEQPDLLLYLYIHIFIITYEYIHL